MYSRVYRPICRVKDTLKFLIDPYSSASFSILQQRYNNIKIRIGGKNKKMSIYICYCMNVLK